MSRDFIFKLPPGDPDEKFALWAKCVECKQEYDTRYRVSRNAWETGRMETNEHRCSHCGFVNTYGGNPDYEPRPIQP